MNKEDLLGLLYDGCLSYDALPGLVAALPDEADRREVFAEVLRIAVTGSKARGARDALDLLPPMAMSHGNRGDARGLMELLEPFGDGPGALAERKPPYVDFWGWQRQVAKSIGRREPVRNEARRRWVERCRQDPDWFHAVARLGRFYRTFVILAAAKGGSSDGGTTRRTFTSALGAVSLNAVTWRSSRHAITASRSIRERGKRIGAGRA